VIKAHRKDRYLYHNVCYNRNRDNLNTTASATIILNLVRGCEGIWNESFYFERW